MKTTSILFILCLALLPCTTFAQKGIVQKETNKDGSLSFAEFRTDSVPKLLSNAPQVLKETLKVQQVDNFVLAETKKDDLGFTHQYYQQFYKGVRVAYASYSVHGKNNTISTINGTYHKISNVSTTPSLTEKAALASAMKFVNASVYKWQVPAEEKWATDNLNESYFPNGELVIVKDRLKTNENFRLAWKFDIYAHKPLSRDYVYIDALNGDVIDKDSRIHHANANGTADTRYSGARNIVTDTFTGGFRLRETRNGVRIETLNMRNQGSNFGSATDFTDANNAWTNAEFNNANFDNAALDAHWGAEMVFDYWNTVHNRNSWNGSGGALLNFVHADLVSMGFQNNDNAFWDGTKMTYGDGTTCFRPLTSLDVVAHEIGHGINSSTSRMRFEGESGAINEALSDIWAACIELWAAPPSANDPDKNHWLIGEEIDLCNFALRSMGNPNALSQPDTYLSPNAFWFNTVGCTGANNNDQCGVHTNSGVINFWFFLVSQGGAGTNDLNNAFNVNGIGINSAARIVFNAESIQLASANEQVVTFNQFRTATITAARNLFGANSCEEIAVTRAWFAVGVGANFTSTLSGITGTEPVCTNSTFSVTGLPAWFTVTGWSSSAPANLSINASGVATRLNNFNGKVTITATVSGAGGCTTTLSKLITLGIPLASNSTLIFPSGKRGVNPVTLCKGCTYNFGVDFVAGATSYTWVLPSGFSFVSGSTSATPGIRTSTTGGSYTMYCAVNNACGSSWTRSLGITLSTGGQQQRVGVYPNPTQQDLTIEYIPAEEGLTGLNSIELNSSSAQLDVEVFTVKLFNGSNQEIKSGASSKGKLVLDIRDLKDGFYYLHVIDSQGTTTRHIQIKR